MGTKYIKFDSIEARVDEVMRYLDGQATRLDKLAERNEQRSGEVDWAAYDRSVKNRARAAFYRRMMRTVLELWQRNREMEGANDIEHG